ncbi:MAG: hypothetical protein B6D58_01695 [candidate division Zixibacteria bacterium 4484_95]|nr:MAG: hypothetical protein B6D58_01695 [candidate division Zixibacteria bacterium 4484_95]
MKKLMICALVMVFAVSGAYAAKSSFIFPVINMPTDSSSSPDSFGYTWVDNDNGGSPVYNWLDITEIGVQVEGLMDDNTVGPIDLGFDFPFYWYFVDHLWIGSNGYISFSSDANYSQNFPMIPSPILPNDLVCPLASDIDFTSPYGEKLCYYYTNDVDSFVVSWIDVPEWNDPPQNTSHTFQMILCAADSSITFQYGPQVGNFQNPDGACQIGIEDLVGRTGLRYMYNRLPQERMPHDSLTIRIHPEPNPDFVFHDVGVAGGMNETSGGIFAPVGQDMYVRALIKNYGTVDEENIKVTSEIKRGYLRVYADTVFIESMEPGEEVWVEFNDTYIPDEIDIYSIIFKTTLTGDQFYSNNRDTTELRSYTLPMTLGYADSATGNYTWWIGGTGTGFANEFVMPEPVTVTGVSINYMTSGSTQRSYFYVIPADEYGNPDEANTLWGDTVTTFNPGGWYTVNIPEPINIQAGEKFFVSHISGVDSIGTGMDTDMPLSNRGWENTGSYAPSRDRSNQDICISVVCDVGVGIDDKETSLPTSFNLNQNYPNPFNARTELGFYLAEKSEVAFDIYNIVGQKIKTLKKGMLEAGFYTVTWDGTNNNGEVVSSGVYFYRLTAGDKTQTKKMVMLK